MIRTMFIILLIYRLGGPAYAQALHQQIGGRVSVGGGSGLAGVAVTDGRTVVLTDTLGRYTLDLAHDAELVYLTLPAGYQIPLRDGRPYFYRRLNDRQAPATSYDFELEESAPDKKHAMIVIGDPQVYKLKDVDSCRAYAEDLLRYAKAELRDYVLHGMLTGDMVGDQPQLLTALTEVFSGTGIPFFYTKGNHDLRPDSRSNAQATRDFKRDFGPNYYAFNRGNVHYVVLDNVFYLGRGHEYVGYLSEGQLRWLEQDLKTVPTGSTVVVSLHIPTAHKPFRKDNQQQVMRNASHLYALLEPYQVHIISGHTHLQDHYHPAPHIWEHTQASLSGIFWQGPDCADGTPPGYSIYLTDGDDFNWRYKAIGKPDKHQFRAYAVGENPERVEDLTVLVWNYDPHWKVGWYEDGIYKGLMMNYVGLDPRTTREVSTHKATYDYDWIWTAETDHLFYARPVKADSEITVEVEDRFGNKFKEDVQRKKR